MPATSAEAPSPSAAAPPRKPPTVEPSTRPSSWRTIMATMNTPRRIASQSTEESPCPWPCACACACESDHAGGGSGSPSISFTRAATPACSPPVKSPCRKCGAMVSAMMRRA